MDIVVTCVHVTVSTYILRGPKFMNVDGNLLIIDTPIGAIALPLETALQARCNADDLLRETRLLETHRPASTRFLDASDISELFDLDATWFLTRAREGRLPHVRLGKFVRFDPVEIRDYFHRYPDRHANSEKTHLRQDTDSKG